MSSDNNERFLKRFIEAENSHDLDRVTSLMKDDIVVEDMLMGLVMRGKDE